MKIENIYNSNTITFARALLSLCFLITLIFTPVCDLFPIKHIELLRANIFGLNHLNLFLWFNNIYIPYTISIIVLLISITGIYPRYVCFFQSWISYSIYYTMLVTEGGDQINVIITLLLIPICILDNRKNGWKTINFNVKRNYNKVLLYNSKLAILFIKIQIALLYLNAGVAKIFAPEWANGTAVYYWFNDPTFGAPKWLNYSIGFLFKNDYSVSLINWSVILLEIFLFIGIFLNQKQKYILFILGFLFHLTIVFVHGLPTFWISLTGCLILYFFQLDKTIKENYLTIKILTKNLFKNDKSNHSN
jgi:antimicrobial peptide system SdpB family protein